MHQQNIETLRQEAIRILQLQEKLLVDLLNDPQQILTAAKEGETQTFDRSSTPKAIEALRGERTKLENLEMVLAVVGTMKAGKSTTINAIVGTEVLPNRNAPMTALPTLIRHTQRQTEPRLIFSNHAPLNGLMAEMHQLIVTPDSEVSEILKEIKESEEDLHSLVMRVRSGKSFRAEYNGADEIFEFLLAVNDLVRLAPRMGMNFPFADYDEVHELPVIEVEFAHLKGLESGQGRLVLLDTPGPNEAGQSHLQHMLKDQLQKASAILVVLDYTQLKSDADEHVRQELANIDEMSKDRLFALVNKFDQKDRNGMNKEEVTTFVHGLMDGMLKADNIFPVSSKFGYLANRARCELDLHGRLPDAPWVEDFATTAFGQNWDADDLADPDGIRSAADKLWRKSSFDAPLDSVVRMAHANAATMALSAAASKLDDFSERLGNQIATRETALSKSTKEIQKLIGEIQGDIEAITKTEKTAKTGALKVLKSLETKIQDGFKKTQGAANKEIERYFKEGKRVNYEKELKELELEYQKRRGPKSKTATVFDEKLPDLPRRRQSSGSSKSSKGKDFDEGSSEIEFRSQAEAMECISRIHGAIEDLLGVTNKTIIRTVDKEISDFQEAFSTTIIHQSQDTLGTLNHQLAQNGFDFSLNLPKLRNISLELSAQDMIGEALLERVGTETRLREQSNWKGGGAKRWLGNIFDQYDWGYEDVTVAVNHYVVSLPDIKARATQKLKSGLKQLDSGFTSQIEEPMTTAIDDFFVEFKSRVEHIRSDLLQSLREKQKSEEDQHKLIDSLKKHRKKADRCKIDSRKLKRHIVDQDVEQE